MRALSLLLLASGVAAADEADVVKKIRRTREQIETAEAAAKPEPNPKTHWLDPLSLSKGETGTLPPQGVVVEFSSINKAAFDYKVEKVLDKESMIVRVTRRYPRDSMTLVLKVRTSAYADGSDYTPPLGDFKVLGTEKVSGLTRFVLEPYEKPRDKVKEAAATAAKEKLEDLKVDLTKLLEQREREVFALGSRIEGDVKKLADEEFPLDPKATGAERLTISAKRQSLIDRAIKERRAELAKQYDLAMSYVLSILDRGKKEKWDMIQKPKPAEIIPPDRAVPKGAAPDDGPGKEASDERQFWRFVPAHGSGYFKRLLDGKWQEIGRGGQKMGVWEELNRTPEFVELYDAKRNLKTRLGTGKAWMASGRDSTAFNPSPEGNWEKPDTARSPDAPKR
jgi:hypothetical protein